MAWSVLPAPDDLMRSSSRNARLNAAVDRAARRVAESEAVLHAAVRTSAMARQALERSQLLLAQLERSAAEERQEPTSSRRRGMLRTSHRASLLAADRRNERRDRVAVQAGQGGDDPGRDRVFGRNLDAAALPHARPDSGQEALKTERLGQDATVPPPGMPFRANPGASAQSSVGTPTRMLPGAALAVYSGEDAGRTHRISVATPRHVPRRHARRRITVSLDRLSRRSMVRAGALGLVAVAGVGRLPTPALAQPATPAATPESAVTPQEAQAIARDAYIYGFPIVENYKTLYPTRSTPAGRSTRRPSTRSTTPPGSTPRRTPPSSPPTPTRPTPS